MRSLILQTVGDLPMAATRLCAWYATLAVVFVALEKIWALRVQRVLRGNFGTDTLYYFLNGFLTRILLILPMSAVAGALHRLAPSSYYEWVGTFPVWLRLLGALVAGDIGSYWGHRWSHEVPWLWRFHVIHHSAAEVDWLVNTRAHPVDMAFTRMCGLIPIYVLGLGQPSGDRTDLAPMLLVVAGTFWGYFIHANLRWRIPILEQLISTPVFHHWHHTNDGEEVLNKNYAATLPWVDRLFGTFYLPKRWPAAYGTDTVVSDRVEIQLLEPFGLVGNPKRPIAAQVSGQVLP